MQRAEMAGFQQHFGSNGGDGWLRFPVREVHGNHDAPLGRGYALEVIRDRNKTRKDLAAVSSNGVHYSWDWGNVHFVCLGIVVGSVKDVDRPRRYPALESFDFLVSDLKEKVGDSGRPVVITHHVDVARYCTPMGDPARQPKDEWDLADVMAYYDVLKKYRVAGILYGHTHQRRIFAWNGTPPSKNGAKDGVPVFNTDNAAHFNFESQAFLHFQLTDREIIAREYFTEEGWKNGMWRPQVWRYPLRA
jgi:cytolysin (calcineurin-like family phosphatase)